LHLPGQPRSRRAELEPALLVLQPSLIEDYEDFILRMKNLSITKLMLCALLAFDLAQVQTPAVSQPVSKSPAALSATVLKVTFTYSFHPCGLEFTPGLPSELPRLGG
jgi:hypothetical protein